MATGDIKINFDTSLYQGDLVFENNDLVMDEGLETAVLVSLFTDRRAREDDELPDPRNGSKRGWFGDQLSDIENDEIGSRLWLLERAKATQENVEFAIEAAQESLQWMIDDLIAIKIDIQGEIQGQVENRVCALEIKIYKTDGTEVSLQYDVQWEGTV